MHRFKNILFSPLGDSGNQQAVARLAGVARDNQARLTLLGVIPDPSGLQRLVHRPEFFAESEDADYHDMADRLTQWATVADDPRPPIEKAVEHGHEADHILEHVGRADHDLLVVTSDEDRHDHGTIKKLLRSCPCPVWVIRQSRGQETQRVLAAVNPIEDGFERSRDLLELAASMTERGGGELHLVHAWTLEGEAAMRSSSFMNTTPDELQSLLEDEQAKHTRQLADLLTEAGLQNAPWTVHLLKGSAVEVIEQVIETARINLLVIGTAARAGLAGMVIGNTAEKVLDYVEQHHIGCSIMTVRASES